MTAIPPGWTPEQARERLEAVRKYPETAGWYGEDVAALLALLDDARDAVRELHDEMWTVSDDDGPEYVSSEGLKYLRGWFDRTTPFLARFAADKDEA